MTVKMDCEIRIRVTGDLHEQLLTLAAAERRTLPDMVRMLLLDGLAAKPLASEILKPPALPGGKTRRVGKGLSVPVQPAKPAKKDKRENLFEAV